MTNGAKIEKTWHIFPFAVAGNSIEGVWEFDFIPSIRVVAISVDGDLITVKAQLSWFIFEIGLIFVGQKILKVTILDEQENTEKVE